MRKLINIILISFLVLLFSCEDYLETKPLGKTSTENFYSYKGVDGLLTGTYALIDGTASTGSLSGAVSNWIWGGVASDDAYKGTTSGDNPEITSIEQYHVLATNGYCDDKWAIAYDGVSRSNDCLKALYVALENNAINEDEAIEFEAEAKFLRAWFHFELKRVFNNIPYITNDIEDETVVLNTTDAWPNMESDMQSAVDNLPKEQDEVGRPTKYAAMAILARIYLFEHKYSEAKPLLDTIINSGNYHLVDSYHNNFKIATNNNAESIFEIQYAVNDGAYNSSNAGWGDALNFPQGGPFGTCCGFYQPSQNLVNAFKVDDNGLPLFDTFNDENLLNDANVDEKTPFQIDQNPVDPRLDWTVGRRGIPFLDWGVDPGKSWVRDPTNGGPYLYKKNMFYSSEKNSLTTTTGWATGINANNYRTYRLAHVYLWRAEVAIEENDLETARHYINLVRERAGDNVVMGKSSEILDANGKVTGYTVDPTQPAANYKVGLYPSFPNQEYARKAVQWELRLEFAMEGQRFFDLVRWGIAAKTLNSYINKEKTMRTYLLDESFTKGVNEYWPIPQAQIDLQNINGTTDILEQNPGY